MFISKYPYPTIIFLASQKVLLHVYLKVAITWNCFSVQISAAADEFLASAGDDMAEKMYLDLLADDLQQR